MGYYLDFEKISLNQFKTILRKSDLVPSRLILLNDLDQRFSKLNSLNIRTLTDLFEALKTKKRLTEFAKKTGIDENYMAILIRELKSIRPKPNRIVDFPDVPQSLSHKLEKFGIKNSKQLYTQTQKPQNRLSLSESTGIDIDMINRLTRLSDLSRVKWVNHTFAYMLLESGYKSVQAVADANVDELHQAINKIIRDKNFYRGQIGLRDINRCIQAAKLLPRDISW